MKILLVHLSDIHFTADANPIAQRVPKLKEAIMASCPAADVCLIAVSGDVARTGDPEEYSVAHTFLSDLRTSLLLAGINQVELALIPGNHDCNFRNQLDTRLFLLDSLATYLSKPIDFNGANFEAIMSVQDDFFQFEAVLRDGEPVPIAQRLYFRRVYNVLGKSIVFHCFNTAWLSRKNEVQSELYIPPQVLEGSTGPDVILSVGMFHHPYNWINADNYRALKRFVETTTDIVLTGHEHVADISRRKKLNGEQIDYIEAPVLQGSTSEGSGFQVLSLDTDRSSQDMRRYEWKSTYYSEISSGSWTLSRNAARPDNPFKPNASFLKELRAVGVGIRHPRCAPLILS